MAATRNRYQFPAVFGEVLTYQGTMDLPNAATGSGTNATATATVPGAAFGDFVVVSMGVTLAGAYVGGYVSAADTVTVVLLNNTAGAVDLASTTVRIAVLKPNSETFYA